MQYNTEISSHINEIIQNADLLHNNTLLQKVYNVVNDITNLDLEDKRKLKFTTTLDSLEPHIIDKLCEITGFTQNYVNLLQHTVFCHTFAEISYEHFWAILRELHYPFAQKHECNLHKILYESFKIDQQPMTIASFILAVSVLQDTHKDVKFMKHVKTTIPIEDIIDGMKFKHISYVNPYLSFFFNF